MHWDQHGSKKQHLLSPLQLLLLLSSALVLLPALLLLLLLLLSALVPWPILPKAHSGQCIVCRAQ